MFIKNGDDPKTKIVRIIEADELDESLDEIMKKSNVKNSDQQEMKEEVQ